MPAAKIIESDSDVSTASSDMPRYLNGGNGATKYYPNGKHANGHPNGANGTNGANGHAKPPLVRKQTNGTAARPAAVIHYDETHCSLHSPTAMPLAAGFLWNSRMMIHMNARGYATAQFMDPEPSKYAHAPIQEAKHFMLPEQGTYTNHPGRFFFVKDRDTGALFSAPYEPARAPVDSFEFDVTPDGIRWDVRALGLRVELRLSLPAADACELWEVRVSNTGAGARRISFYPAFPLGLLSWMNQSAHFDYELNAVVAECITAYQKIGDYFKNQHLKDKVFLLSERKPQAFETRQTAFEGEGGLHSPDGVTAARMAGGEASYENPIAAMQFDHDLAPGAGVTHRFVFGPAFDKAEVARVRATFLSEAGFAAARTAYSAYIAAGRGAVHMTTPDAHLDAFINTWLPRQVYYHGDTNRLSTDPQTRNFLQDAIGCVYIAPGTARKTLLKALTQQRADGSLPDGIKLYEGAELKYINTVPHVDHSVWLPLFLDAYLDETDDYALLDEMVAGAQGGEQSVRERTSRAMRYLIGAVDHRGLHLIEQGDWNDPMNMVGYKGRGVSGWMSLASAFALRLWAKICAADDHAGAAMAAEFEAAAATLNKAVNEHLWDGEWFGRGITDDGAAFGVAADEEGRIYLNPQSFALMSGAADERQTAAIVRAVEEQLETPFGVEMLGPSYTHMRADIGRLTQKFPGVAENGSAYNHAAVFYVYALFGAGPAHADRAAALLRRMLPGPDPADYARRGQLPVFVPNYYRGAHRTHPGASGRSSHLFNTGTAAWFYRSAVEGLLGLRGCRAGLRVAPAMPSAWPEMRATRLFRGARFEVHVVRGKDVGVRCDGVLVAGGVIGGVEAGRTYQVEVVVA